MNSQIETWRVQQFAANVYQLSQQKGSRLGGVVRSETFKGKSEFFDRLATASAQQKTGRNTPTPNLDITHSRRMVTTSLYEWATLVDRKDKLQNIHSPENEYSVAARNALGRSMDSVIIAAALGTAATGESGTGTQTLGTGQKVAAVSSGAMSRLNVDALLRAKQLMDAAEVVGPRYLIHTAAHLSALLGQTQVTNSDYNTVKALVNGEVNSFLGFTFIHTELLPLSSVYSSTFTFNTTSGLYSASGSAIGATEVSAIALCGDGLILGKNEGAVARIDERADMSYSNQVYASMDFGAVRMEEVKVVEIISLP